MAMQPCILVFDVEDNELQITINNETLVINDFLTDRNNMRVTTLTADGQEKLIKKLVNNMILCDLKGR